MSSTGLRIVEPIASLYKWYVFKADIKRAILQTFDAERQVFFKLPRKSKMRSKHFWPLLTAAYGPVNANAKWQVHSDSCLHELRLRQIQQIPQFFLKKYDGKLRQVPANVADDILVAGIDDNAKQLIDQFNKDSSLELWRAVQVKLTSSK